MKKILIATVSVIVFGISATAVAIGAEPSPSVIAAKLERLYAVDESPLYSGNERIEAIVSAYERIFDKEQGSALESVTDADLDLLYQAANTAAFYSGKRAYANEMARLLAELEGRGLANREHWVDMHRALVGARMFDKARALQHAHPLEGMEILPEIRMDPGLEGLTTWSVSATGRRLTEQPLDLQVPATIVVVSTPRCRFSQAAVAAIDDDSVLGPVFARHAQWLAPPSGKLDFDLMQEWNGEHPKAPLSLAIERDDLPMIDNWNTPTFYFFKDGELAAKVQGWPRDGVGRRTEVAAALRKIGLLE